MDPLTIASLGTQAVTGLVQGITGAVQKAKAAKMARKNIRPIYEIQKPVLDNQDIAETQAGEGISDAAKQVYSTGAERGLTSSIDAILKGGGSVNNIATLYDNYEGGISRLALVDEEARARHIKTLMDQNETYAGELDKQWQYNKAAPYADTAQAAAALAKQGSDNEWKGINTFGSAVSNAATGNMFKKEGNNVFGGSNSSSAGGTINAGSILGGGGNGGGQGSGMGRLDPIMINGVMYDPYTMQPI